jgi:hypothetical protein
MGKNMTVDSNAGTVNAPDNDIVSKLKDLKILFEQDLITEEQYKAKQSKLLESL